MPRSRRHSALPLKLIMKIGPLPDACQTPAGRLHALEPGFHRARTHWIRGFSTLEPLPDALDPGFTAYYAPRNALDPGFHCARTHWIRGFMAFQLARRTRTVMLMVPE